MTDHDRHASNSAPWAPPPERLLIPEGAQSTVEYALVLLGAAALALLLVSWVTGTDVIGRLFESVFSHIIGRAT
jgi:hypothetical protein